LFCIPKNILSGKYKLQGEATKAEMLAFPTVMKADRIKSASTRHMCDVAITPAHATRQIRIKF
jgi:hypothetical protein